MASAVVAAMISTMTTATTPPMMATVLSEAELSGSGSAAAVCGGGVDNPFPGLTGAAKV